VTRLDALVLCYFDNLKGPTITHVLNLESTSTAGNLPPNVLTEIAKLIDTQNKEEFFTYGFEAYTTGNIYFEIPSGWARGKQEILCLSVLTQSGKPDLFKETLIGGARRLKAIPNIYKAFHIEQKAQDREVGQKRQELEEFLANFCQDVNHAREKAIAQEKERETKRNQSRDRKRDRGRDETRDQDRDEPRDSDRDETRDLKRDEPRDSDRDETRDLKRDEPRDLKRDEPRDRDRDETNGIKLRNHLK
jgi:hypothetical protein